MNLVAEQEDSALGAVQTPSLGPNRGILIKFCTSHLLSTWNSRLFEFGAVLFLARLFPGTLFYASVYAFVRSLVAVFLSGQIGTFLDNENRLKAIRWTICLNRGSVVISGLIFISLLGAQPGMGFWTGFFALNCLACLEKLSIMANTVAVERDWLIVVANSISCDRQQLNAVVRRIDLGCKLLAPLLLSFVDAYSTKYAIYFVTVSSLLSVVVEYFSISTVYAAVPDLAFRYVEHSGAVDHLVLSEHDEERTHVSTGTIEGSCPPDWLQKAADTWRSYFSSTVALPSVALSLLYLTVLSTGVQFQTFLIAVGLSSTTVSVVRMAAVLIEVTSTFVTPVITKRIGTIRCGLWSVNWQFASLIGGTMLFVFLRTTHPVLAAYSLSGGIVASRLGLWGFDLCVQDLVQEEVDVSSRGRFSANEIALQNLFELLSFLSTIIYPNPLDFNIPAVISCFSVFASASLFAVFVRRRRGHLLHPSRCMLRKQEYSRIAVVDLEDGFEGIALPTI